MKKSLTFKLMFITSITLIVSFVAFLIIISNVFKTRFIEVNNAKLIQYVTSTQKSWQNGKMEKSGYEYIIGDNNSSQYQTSTNILNIIDTSSISKLISEYKSSSFKIAPVVKNHKTFYSCGYSENGKYIICLSDGSYIKNQTNSLVFTISLIFLIIIVLSELLIYFYSKKIINRINNIKKDVLNLSDNNYKLKIETQGDDEIGELAKGIENLRINIDNSNEQIKESFQNLSHDLKTPIAVIKSYAEAINDGIEDIKSINIILSEAESLEIKANKLLELNKIEYIKDLDLQDINLKDLIINETKKYLFDFDLELENVYFKGFIDNYIVVIDNLIDNAMRYKKSIIKITLKNDYLELYNDGAEIEPELINSLFDPYVKGKDGCFGLGLSIVKRTLDVFGYIIEVKNNNGVSFVIKKR